MLGSTIRDEATGQPIGRALIIPWRGRIHFVGLEDQPVVPMFRAEPRLTYWRQTLVFAAHPAPDFPRIRNGPPGG